MTNRLVLLTLLIAGLCQQGKASDPRAEWPAGKKPALGLSKALVIAQKLVGSDYYCVDAHLYMGSASRKQGKSEFTPHPIWTIRFDSRQKGRKDIWVFENGAAKVYDYGKSGNFSFK